MDSDRTVDLVEGGPPVSVRYRLIVPPSRLCSVNHTLHGSSCRLFVDHLPQDHAPPQSVFTLTHSSVLGRLKRSQWLVREVAVSGGKFQSVPPMNSINHLTPTVAMWVQLSCARPG